MKAQNVLFVLTLALACGSCGGSGGYGGGGTPPTAPAPTGSNIVTISIVGNKGSTSFSPNPAMCPTGQMVVWRNTDTIAHRIVIDSLSIDTGNINPGASSPAMPLGDVSKPYHCQLHPTMVGSLNGAPTPDPGMPCDPLCGVLTETGVNSQLPTPKGSRSKKLGEIRPSGDVAATFTPLHLTGLFGS